MDAAPGHWKAGGITVETLMVILSGPLQSVVVDRPFFFVIRDVPTNTLLFVGREVDPK